ncbi:MAG: Uma2 family endonuclease [Actinobacteria bacterium]|nr:Uma2 family endonuclease [Actinomycetota bacterium]
MGAVRHRFTVEEYRRMGEARIFSEDDRVELIDGEVLEMAPIGDRHIESVMRLTRLISRWALDTRETGLFVSVQNPLALGEHGEPQPDLTLVRRRGDRSGIPIPEELLLVVEVAYISLAYDRETKLPLYAEAGIPEAWLVDLTTDAIEVYSEPGPGGYRRLVRIRRDERIVSATLPDLAFDAAEALPPEG